MWPNVYNGSALQTWATQKQFGLARTPNLKLISWYHDRIEIDTSFSVMAVTPQTPKCHHNLGCASVVVTFGSLWCHSHDLNSVSIPSTYTCYPNGILYTALWVTPQPAMTVILSRWLTSGLPSSQDWVIVPDIEIYWGSFQFKGSFFQGPLCFV